MFLFGTRVPNLTLVYGISYESSIAHILGIYPILKTLPRRRTPVPKRGGSVNELSIPSTTKTMPTREGISSMELLPPLEGRLALPALDH